MRLALEHPKWQGALAQVTHNALVRFVLSAILTYNLLMVAELVSRERDSAPTPPPPPAAIQMASADYVF